MPDNNLLWKYLYPFLASLAGAFAALAIQPSRDMTVAQIILFLIAGTGFAFFVFPLVFRGLDSPQLAGGVCFLMASAWNILLPVAIRKIVSQTGSEK